MTCKSWTALLLAVKLPILVRRRASFTGSARDFPGPGVDESKRDNDG